MTKRATDRAFWDSSGLALLIVGQKSAPAARAIRRTTGPMIVWWGSRVEVASALARLVREGALRPSDLPAATAKLDAILAGAAEVTPSDDIRARAVALCDAHPLRSGDALQLAAAMAAALDRPARRVFVCFDRRLGDVARTVGFDVRP